MRSIVPLVVAAAFGLSVATCSQPQFERAGSQCSSSPGNLEARDIDAAYSKIPLYAVNAVNLTKRVTGTGGFSDHGQAANSIHRKTQAIKLTSVEPFRWTGDVWIGQPEQGPFRLQFNTGDEHLWITDHKAPHGGYKTYDHTRSHGAKLLKENVQYKLTATSGIFGPMYQDKVRIGNLELYEPFISATAQRPSWAVDGDFGLAPISLQDMQGRPPLMRFQEHIVGLSNGHDCRFYAFYLSQVDPKFFLCDFDPTLAPGGVDYHYMITDFDGWALGGGDVFVNGKNHIEGKDLGDPRGLQTSFHSGTPYVAGPRDVVAAIYKSIRGHPKDDCFYYFPCKDAIELSFSWDHGKLWKISREDFILEKLPGGVCVGSLVARPKTGRYSDNQRWWILGGSFMKDKLTVFDPRRRAIGFHEAK